MKTTQQTNTALGTWDDMKGHLCPLRRRERVFEEIMTKNFPNLVKNINLQVQEAQQVYI